MLIIFLTSLLFLPSPLLLFFWQSSVPAQYVEYFLLGIMALTGTIKLLASGGMAKDFYFVPKWAFPLLGLYQLYTVFLMHVKNDYAAAAPLIYIFFGGVIFCMMRSNKLLAAPFPLSVVLATWSTALKHGADTARYATHGWSMCAVRCAVCAACEICTHPPPPPHTHTQCHRALHGARPGLHHRAVHRLRRLRSRKEGQERLNAGGKGSGEVKFCYYKVRLMKTHTL